MHTSSFGAFNKNVSQESNIDNLTIELTEVRNENRESQQQHNKQQNAIDCSMKRCFVAIIPFEPDVNKLFIRRECRVNFKF